MTRPTVPPDVSPHGSFRTFLGRSAATVAGLFVGMAANMLIVQLNMVMHPAPEGFDWNDQQAVLDYLGQMPWTGFAMAILAHLAQAFFGGWVAARLTPHAPMFVAMIIGTLSAVGGVLNLQMIPHPWWMWGELPLYFVAAWTAGHLEVRRRARLPADGV
jgi:hypothetical protein